MLHTLSRSPVTTDLATLLHFLNENDAILLYQDGVLWGITQQPSVERLLLVTQKVYVLEEDVIARGLLGHISESIILINYARFVELSAQYPQQMVW